MDDPAGCFRFDRFVLDARTLELRADGRSVPLEPLPARLLVRLVERTGEMVSRRELLELGWPRLPEAAGDSLNTCIRQIRDALGDDARRPRFVETLRGRGYRFNARVEPAPVRRPSMRTVLAAVAGAAAMILLSVVAPRRPAPPPQDVRAALARVQWILESGRDVTRALSLADSLAAGHPALAAVHAARAELRLFAGDPAGARAAATLATTLDADEPVAQRVMAHVHAFAGAWAAADEAMGISLKAAPDEARSWLAHAFLLTVRGRFDEADAALRRAQALDPRSPFVHGDIGLMHLYAGRSAAAVEACGAMLAAEPDATWAMDCLMDAHLLANRRAEAALWAERLLAAAGDTAADDAVEAVRARRIAEAAGAGPSSRYRLALAFADAGRRSEALDALERAVATPGFGVLTVAVEPRFAGLRDDARFRRIVDRFHLGRTLPH